MPTSTLNYGLQKPLVDDPTDEDLWGDYLNDDLDDVDTLIKQGITITNAASQTGDFSASASISVKTFYPCDATAGAITVTLPAAATAGNGATVFFKKTDSGSNAVAINRAGADTIDGATSRSLSSQYDTLGLISDGVDEWRVLISPTATPTTPIIRHQQFTSTGTFTAPANTVASTVFKFTITGGGGSGGGGFTGSGGSGAGTCIAYVSGLSANTGYTCTVGAGGAASAANADGNDGANSTVVIGATTYTGGKGLKGVSAGTRSTGGTATNGNINIDGGDGGLGYTSSSTNKGGQGGGTFWGPGAPDNASNSGGNGVAATVYGAGGSGSSVAGGTSGAGKAGIITVEWIL